MKFLLTPNDSTASEHSLLNGIALYEKIDMKIMNQLIASSFIDEYKINERNLQANIKYDSLKKQLIAFKRLIDDGKKVVYNVSYKAKFGRVYPKASLSLGLIEREFRHALGKDFYVDIDVDNCHPTLLVQICESLGISIVALKDYVDNRAYYLKLVMDTYKVNREQAKKLFIRLLYGGRWIYWMKDLGICGKPIDIMENLEREYISVSNSLLKNVAKDWYKDFKIRIAENLDEETKKKNKKDSKKKQTDDEKDEEDRKMMKSGLSYYLQEWERRVLLVMFNFCKFKGLIKEDVAVLCFDGLMILKGAWKDEYLKEMEELILKETNFKLKLSTKALDEGEELLEKLKKEKFHHSEEQLKHFDADHFIEIKHYTLQKEYFENFFCRVLEVGYIQNYKKMDDGDENNNIEKLQQRVIMYKDSDFKERFRGYNSIIYPEDKNGQLTEENVKFVKHWIDDENILQYQEIVFYPEDKTETEMNAIRLGKKGKSYNIFTGYNNAIRGILKPQVDDKDKDKIIMIRKEMTLEEAKTITETWRKITLELCEGNEKIYKYYCSVLNSKISQPATRHLLLTVLFGSEGIGKNKHLEAVKYIINPKHYVETSKLSAIFGEHSETSMNKLMIVLNEVEAKYSQDYEVILKDVITNPTIEVNPKNIRAFTVDNNGMYFITSNKSNIIKMDMVTGNRRNLGLKATDVYKNDKSGKHTEMWKKFNDDIKTDLHICALYTYLKSFDISNFDITNMPKTKGTDILVKNSKPIINTFMDSWIYERRDMEVITTTRMTLFSKFCEYCDANSIKHDYSNGKFGNALENLNMSSIVIKNIEHQYGYSIDMVKLIEQSKVNCIYEMWKLETQEERLLKEA